jgi:hypothetical protein
MSACQHCYEGYIHVGVEHQWVPEQIQVPFYRLKRRSTDPTIIDHYETITRNKCSVCHRQEPTEPYCYYQKVKCPFCGGTKFMGKNIVKKRKSHKKG